MGKSFCLAWESQYTVFGMIKFGHWDTTVATRAKVTDDWMLMNVESPNAMNHPPKHTFSGIQTIPKWFMALGCPHHSPKYPGDFDAGDFDARCLYSKKSTSSHPPYKTPCRNHDGRRGYTRNHGGPCTTGDNGDGMMFPHSIPIVNG